MARIRAKGCGPVSWNTALNLPIQDESSWHKTSSLANPLNGSPLLKKSLTYRNLVITGNDISLITRFRYLLYWLNYAFIAFISLNLSEILQTGTISDLFVSNRSKNDCDKKQTFPHGELKWNSQLSIWKIKMLLTV